MVFRRRGCEHGRAGIRGRRAITTTEARSSAASPPGTAAAPPPRPEPARFLRRRQGRLIAGVASGLSQHLGLSRTAVRIAFAVLCGVGGFGGMLYIAFWAVVPLDRRQAAEGRRRRLSLPEAAQAVVLLAVGTGATIGIRGIGLGGSNAVVIPAVIATAGVALIWRQADESQRADWSRRSPRFPWIAAAVGRSRRAFLLRVVTGGALVALGIATFLATSGRLQEARQGLVATVVIVGGLALVTGPWWWRLVSDLGRERQARIRSQERAEVAAHLHDSVLQTLALIQRHVDEPREVARLARSQERELRAWLYRRERAAGPATLESAIEEVAGEVEDAYALKVQTVVVRDTPLTPPLDPLVQAAREALVNVGKHAGVDDVSLYVEVEHTGTEPTEVSVFVRDRGRGFDPAAVPADRRGLSGSVVGRMERHGGTAAVRSRPGEGTEVELRMPLRAGASP